MLNKRKNFPVRSGVRVRLINMDDPYSTLQEGDEGTIKHIDDAGIIHVNWDNGSTLGLIPKVDKYVVLNENENMYKPFPKAGERDDRIGSRNARLYQQAEERMMDEGGYDETPQKSAKQIENEEPEDPFEGKERRFRASIYADVHVPMTADIEADRITAEQVASEILKKLSQKDVSNVYLGGVADNPYGSIPNPKEFDRL